MDSFGWREKLEQFKLPIALSLVGAVLIIGGIFASGLSKNPSAPSTNSGQASSGQVFPKESLVKTQKEISVDVSGAVEKPGVYKLSDVSRIEDAIKAAGGFSSVANTEYISKYLNMAQKLSDGSKVYIPVQGEGGISQTGTGEVAGVRVQTKVNINMAAQSELEALPGIGPVTASKIISDRPYGSAEELLSKKVVSKSVFDKIKDQLVVY